MQNLSLRITYIGGPTALIEIGSLLLLTDPTFDAAGEEYQTAAYTLHKLQSPAIDINADIDRAFSEAGLQPRLK